MTAATTHVLETIIELQKTLSRLRAARAALEGIPDSMREVHTQHSARQAAVDDVEQAVAAAAKERRAAELAVEEAQASLKRFQEHISRVRTQREYGALLQEIDTAKQQIKTLEQQHLAVVEREDAAQHQLASERADFADLDRRYREELAHWEDQKPGLAAAAEELQAQASELQSRLPRPVLAAFVRIFERYGGEALAVVRTVDRAGRGPQMWSCGACNYSVRPQAVVEIRNSGALIQCDSCKRILYFDGATA